jgi:hypothetical protein
MHSSGEFTMQRFQSLSALSSRHLRRHAGDIVKHSIAQPPIARPRAMAALALASILTAVLAACGTVKDLWRTEPEERLVIPQGATAYRCNAGKSFFIRRMDEGRAVWVMLIEREFRLEAPAAGATRFTNGRTALNLNGDQASLEEGSVTTYAGCVRYQPGVKTEPVKGQPARGEPAKAEPGKAEPAKSDSKGEAKGEVKGEVKGEAKGEAKDQPAEKKPWWRVW